MSQKYVTILLKEKGINLEKSFHEDKGMIGLTIKVLIENIYSCPPETIKEIEDTFRMIDFKNGDVMHFVEYLMDFLIKSYESFLNG